MNPSCCDQVVQSTFLGLPESVALRAMKASDLSCVRALHRNLLPIPYPTAFFIQLLVNPRRLCLVATDHDTIVGFASAAMGLLQPGSAEGHTQGASADRECSEARSDIPQSHVTLLTLGVLPGYQRRGIGRSLVHGVVRRLEASCVADTPPYRPASSAPDQISGQDGRTTVLLHVQVAKSNLAGKRFYTHLGMIDRQGYNDARLHVGYESHMSVMAGIICV